MNAPEKSPPVREFFAFISYAHEDSEWAIWLARALENYRLPRGVASQRGANDRRLGRVYRDDDESRAASSLSDEIIRALQVSRRLIVICSRASARSRWVSEEVTQFETTRDAADTFFLIVDGTPGASADREGDASQECLPAPVLARLGDQIAQKAPLAVDVRRIGKRGALLKLIAGMLSIEFDELFRRDLKRSITRWAIGSGVAAAVGAGAVFLYVERIRAQVERDTQAEIAFTRGSQRATENDQPAEGLDLALKGLTLREATQSESDLTRTLTEDAARFALKNLRELARVGLDARPIVVIAPPTGEQFALCLTDRTVRVFDASTLIERRRATTENQITACGYDRSGQRIFAATEGGIVHVYDANTMQQRRLFSGNNDIKTIFAGTFIGDDGSVVVAESVGKIHLFAGDGSGVREIHDHGFMARIAALEPTADNSRVVSAAVSGASAVIELATGNVHTFGGVPAYRLSTHPSENRFLIARMDGNVEERSATTTEELGSWSVRSVPTQAEYSADGTEIRLAGQKIGPAVFDTQSHENLWQLNLGTTIEFSSAVAQRSVFSVSRSGAGAIVKPGEPIQSTAFNIRGEPRQVQPIADGNYLITIDSRQVMQAWDLRWPSDFQPLQPAEPAAGAVDAQFTSDGGVVLLDEAGQFHQWSAATRQFTPGIRIEGEPESFKSLSDGTWIVAMADSSVRHIDASGRTLQTFQNGGWAIANFIVNRELSRLLTVPAGIDAPALLWDLASGKQIAKIGYEDTEFSSCEVSPDGSQAMFSTENGSVSVWRGGTPAAALLQEFGEEFSEAYFDAAGKQIVSVSANTVAIWDVATGTRSIEREVPDLIHMSFLDDGRLMAVFATEIVVYDGNLRPTNVRIPVDADIKVARALKGGRIFLQTSEGITIGDARTGASRRTLARGDLGIAADVGGELIVAWDDQRLRAWSLSGDEIQLASVPEDTESDLGVSHGMKLEAKGKDATLLRDIPGNLIGTINIPHEDIVCFDATPDGSRVLVGTDSNVLSLWNTQSGERFAEVTLDPSSVTDAVLGQGDSVAFHFPDTFERMQLRNGNDVVELSRDSGRWIEAIAATTSGKFLASAGRDRTVRIWDSSGKNLAQCELDNQIWNVAFAPDERHVVAVAHNRLRFGEEDKVHQVTVLDWATCERVMEKRFEGDHIDVAFSEDSRSILWRTDAHALEVWDVGSGLQVASLQHDKDFFLLAQHGNRVITTDEDGAIRLWELPPRGEKLLAIARARLKNIDVDAKGVTISDEADETSEANESE